MSLGSEPLPLRAAWPFPKLGPLAGRVLPPLLGLGLLVGLWAIGSALIAASPRLVAFRGFAPDATLAALQGMLASGEAWRAALPSLSRIGQGLFWAVLIGAPLGVAFGTFRLFERIANLPFQILRMISPLSWMPIAILAFPSWDGAIVFLITAAAIWPILFATAAGVKRIDPAWLAVGRTLGGATPGLLRRIILPAVLPDLLTGFRLALGVAWVVLVPAEFLGVTSGLGYAINDARDTLEYDRLAALVVLIGLIGFALDSLLGQLLARARWTPST